MLAAAALVLGLGAARGEQLFGEDDIRRELIGQHAAGIYPSGAAWEETFGSDGTTLYAEGRRTHPGRWFIRSGLFCFSYDAGPSSGCFQVWRVSPNCYELFTILDPDVPAERPESRTGRSWNGRMWRAAEASTCAPWQGS